MPKIEVRVPSRELRELKRVARVQECSVGQFLLEAGLNQLAETRQGIQRFESFGESRGERPGP